MENWHVDWQSAYNWVERRLCMERRKTGTCYCMNKRKKYNPCERAVEIMDDMYALSTGRPANRHDLESLAKWVKNHRCRNARCNHRACIEADAIVSFLNNQTAVVVKAA